LQNFVIENIYGDAECVICSSFLPISKLYNIKRHYSLKHSDFKDLIDGRERKLLELKAKYFLLHVAHTIPNKDNSALKNTSYVCRSVSLSKAMPAIHRWISFLYLMAER